MNFDKKHYSVALELLREMHDYKKHFAYIHYYHAKQHYIWERSKIRDNKLKAILSDLEKKIVGEL